MIAFAIAFWFLQLRRSAATLLVGPLARGFHPDRRSRARRDSVGAIVVLGGGIHEVSAGSVTPWISHHDETALRMLEGGRVFRLLEGQPLIVASGGIRPGRPAERPKAT